ncbi:E3 SUMO-protein ligase ZBED1-like [Diretmus argenteus]
MAENETPIRPAPSSFKASVWQHFGFYEVEGKRELDKTHTICKLCRANKKYSGNTTNMRDHLARWHPELGEKNENTAPASNQTTIPETISKLPPNSERAKRITRSIGIFIVKDLRPYSVVENAGFRGVLKATEPRYVIPARSTFTNTVIPNLYKETKSDVQDSLDEAGRIALTTDAWTSVATDSYVTITAHFISDNWQLLSFVLQTRRMTEQHTGRNLVNLINTAAQEWNVSIDDLAIVTDNASNMIVAAQMGNYLHVKCFAHTINLASQRALKLPLVVKLLGNIRRVSAFFHRSTNGKAMLDEKQKQIQGLQKPKKLKTDVSTRWNSAYEMVERFLFLQPSITATLLSPEIRKKETDIATFSTADISNAEVFMHAMKPMMKITKLMSEEKKPTISMIAPLHAQLIRDTANGSGQSSLAREMHEAIHADMIKRYTTPTEKNTLRTASALDPRSKGLDFLSQEEIEDTYGRVIAEAASLEQEVRVEEESGDEAEKNSQSDHDETDEDEGPAPKKRAPLTLLEDLLGKTFKAAPVEEQPKSAYERAEVEVTKYRSTPSLGLKGDPLGWWRKKEEDFPLLAKLAKRYLCIPGTSVPAERVFSTAGDILTAQRSTLKPSHVDQLLFLAKNLP